MTSALQKRNIRKLLVQTLTGAAVGAAGTFLFLELGGKVANFDDPSRIFSAGVGMIYLLIGLFVGLGALMPGVGATFLNVEDAGELVEERNSIGPAAIVCLMMGIPLMLLALTPGGDLPGAVSTEFAAAVSLVCLTGLVAAGIWLRGRYDEFNRQLGVEASAIAMHVSLLLFGGWGALAHLGYVPWTSPLALLAGFAAIELAAIFWVVGRRGLLAPR